MGFGFPPLEFPGPVTGPCDVSPVGQPGPGDNFGFWITREIEPGKSRTCNFGFRATDTSVRRQVARWESFVFDADDPNASNNEAELLLLFGELPSSQPIPLLSRVGLTTLALLLGIVALLAISGRWP